MEMTFKEKLLDKLDNIRLFFRDIKIEIESFFVGISNFWYYRKLIYKDRWYDHSFFLNMIEFKMKQMEDNWDDSHYLGSNFTKLRIKSIRRRIKYFEDELDELTYDYIVHKLWTKEEFKDKRDKIIHDSFTRLGRNMRRFWD